MSYATTQAAPACDPRDDLGPEPFCAVCGDPLPYEDARCANDCPPEDERIDPEREPEAAAEFDRQLRKAQLPCADCGRILPHCRCGYRPPAGA